VGIWELAGEFKFSGYEMTVDREGSEHLGRERRAVDR